LNHIIYVSIKNSRLFRLIVCASLWAAGCWTPRRSPCVPRRIHAVQTRRQYLGGEPTYISGTTAQAKTNRAVLRLTLRESARGCHHRISRLASRPPPGRHRPGAIGVASRVLSVGVKARGRSQPGSPVSGERLVGPLLSSVLWSAPGRRRADFADSPSAPQTIAPKAATLSIPGD